MNEISGIKTKIKRKALLLSAGLSLIFLLFGKILFALGLITGTLASILNFELLARFLSRLNPQNITRRKRRGRIRFFTGYLFRYIMLALILWAAVNKGWEFFFGACLGLFSIKAGIYLELFWGEKWETLPD